MIASSIYLYLYTIIFVPWEHFRSQSDVTLRIL